MTVAGEVPPAAARRAIKESNEVEVMGLEGVGDFTNLPKRRNPQVQ
jgi:hypothetical protein